MPQHFSARSFTAEIRELLNGPRIGTSEGGVLPDGDRLSSVLLKLSRGKTGARRGIALENFNYG